MNRRHIYPSALLRAGLTLLAVPSVAEVYPLILRGKVLTKDGSPLPKQISIQRLCSDDNGSAPGPLVDKKGDYLWRMDVDPMRTQSLPSGRRVRRIFLPLRSIFPVSTDPPPPFR